MTKELKVTIDDCIFEEEFQSEPEIFRDRLVDGLTLLKWYYDVKKQGGKVFSDYENSLKEVVLTGYSN